MFRSRLILIALVIECSLAGVVCAQSKSQINNEKAKDLLGKILATRNKMRNLQYEFETTCWYDLDLAKGHFNKYVLPPKEGYDTDFGIISIVLDCDGRGKRELKQCGVVDSSGKKIPVETLMKISAWDGHTGVDYRYGHKVGYPDYAYLDDSPPSYVKNFGHPWWENTGILVEQLTKAIEAEKPVNVETLPDGKYRISIIRIIDSLAYETIAVIDPEQGFSCTKQTSIGDGIIYGYRTTEYEEFIDGVWLPVRAEHVVNKEGAVLWKATEKMKKIKVNDPNFNEGLFHIDLPKGTRVTDKANGIKYRVGVTSLDGVGKDKFNPLKDKPLPDMKQFAVVQDPNQTKDKMMLVCFFDMDQRPSRNCMRQLSAKAQELKTKGVLVVAVHASKVDDNKLRLWIQKYHISFPVGMIKADAPKTRIAWGVRSLPRLILTDTQHVVIAEGFSVTELDEKLKGNSQ
ncbi:MAG: hypothetical protein WBC05_13490 [Sedimentisphaerales bacterium]